jgi:hypothetical protein
MTTLLPTVRTQLFDAAERRRHGRLLARVLWGSALPRWRRAPLIVLGAALALVGGAFGAGLIEVGTPAKGPFYLLGNPHEGFGTLVPGTVRLLPIAAPDPAGGPDWGMRELSTSRGEGCLEIGRLLNGRLGALGRDQAFGNDGRFHELPAGALDINDCTALDGRGRLFANIVAADRPASAWTGVGVGAGCVPPTAGPYEKGLRLTARERALGARPNPICPQSDLRNIYYGLLGPEAVSITYVLDGEHRTLPTVGTQGAYLFVTKASPHQLLNFADAGTADIVPVDGPIREIHYRDGATCHLTSKSWIGGAYACTPSLPEPVGYVDFARAPSSAEVAAPIHARLVHGRHGRLALRVSFTARLPVKDAHRVYVMRWHESWTAPQIYGGTGTNADIAAGKTISWTIGDVVRPLRAGVIDGTVSLLQAVGAGGLEGPGSASVPVGSFTIRVP